MKDHGVGIDPADHQRIFHRFERAVSEKEFTGLGLGLYIVHQIIRQHGGGIRVESQLEQGAEFIMNLPQAF